MVQLSCHCFSHRAAVRLIACAVSSEFSALALLGTGMRMADVKMLALACVACVAAVASALALHRVAPRLCVFVYAAAGFCITALHCVSARDAMPAFLSVAGFVALSAESGASVVPSHAPLMTVSAAEKTV